MRDFYEAPTTLLCKVVMGDICMAASNPEKINTEVDAFNLKTNQQGDGYTYGASGDNAFGSGWSINE